MSNAANQPFTIKKEITGRGRPKHLVARTEICGDRRRGVSFNAPGKRKGINDRPMQEKGGGGRFSSSAGEKIGYQS